MSSPSHNDSTEGAEKVNATTQKEMPGDFGMNEAPVIPHPDAGDVVLSTEEAPPETAPEATATTNRSGNVNLTEEQIKIIENPELFREYCVKSQHDMVTELATIRSEQKAQKLREGGLAAHMALLALDNAKLHEQFKNKSISRALAAKLNEMATEAGVTPIQLQQFAIASSGPEGAVDDIEAPPEDRSSGYKRRPTDDASNMAKKPKPGSGSKPPPKHNPKATEAELNVLDEGGVLIHGKYFSRENDVIISKWGFRGTGIKNHAGCIIRVPEKIALSSSVLKAAKTAAADKGSKLDRSSLPKVPAQVFGATIAKFVEVVLDQLVLKKTEHAPFLFEKLVTLHDLESGEADVTFTARSLNDTQAVLWSQLLRSAYSNMGLKGTDESIALQGLDAAIQMLQKKVDAMGKKQGKGGGAKVTHVAVEEEEQEEDNF